MNFSTVCCYIAAIAGGLAVGFGIGECCIQEKADKPIYSVILGEPYTSVEQTFFSMRDVSPVKMSRHTITLDLSVSSSQESEVKRNDSTSFSEVITA